ncbi:MAG TPA: 6,7-dimethyl-8-ribityllumazine synthase [Rhizomicrobium sp.]|nr:6,7-dimethyl-8-ribityllumazine synthase [Rhizomicrobium sp.]
MNVLIVEARYHPTVADALLDGAVAALKTAGVQFERAAVPGVLEVPAAIAIALRSSKPFDGFVALGSVTGPQHIADMFYGETMRGLMALSTAGVALGSGIVLAADEGAALDLSLTMDIGGNAVRACLALLVFGERLGFMP